MFFFVEGGTFYLLSILKKSLRFFTLCHFGEEECQEAVV